MSSTHPPPAPGPAGPQKPEGILGTHRTKASGGKVLVPREFRPRLGKRVLLKTNENGSGFYVIPWDLAAPELDRQSRAEGRDLLAPSDTFSKRRLQHAPSEIDDRGRLLVPPEFPGRPQLTPVVYIEGLWDRAEVIPKLEYDRRIAKLIPKELR